MLHNLQGLFCSANYRCPGPEPDRKILWIAEGIQGFAWWWVLWHLWTEPDHITVNIISLPSLARLY